MPASSAMRNTILALQAVYPTCSGYLAAARTPLPVPPDDVAPTQTSDKATVVVTRGYTGSLSSTSAGQRKYSITLPSPFPCATALGANTVKQECPEAPQYL